MSAKVFSSVGALKMRRNTRPRSRNVSFPSVKGDQIGMTFTNETFSFQYPTAGAARSSECQDQAVGARRRRFSLWFAPQRKSFGGTPN